MDYNKRFDQIESILIDVLRVQDRLVAGQEQLVRGQEQQTKLLDRMGLVMDKMLDALIQTKDEIKGLRVNQERLEDHDRRIRKIEQKLSIKGE